MRKRTTAAVWLCAVLVMTGARAADAVEITLISAGAVRAVVSSLAEEFAKVSGHSVRATFGTVGIVRQKLATEPADVVIASDTAIDDLMRSGAIVAGSRMDIARTGVGVGVREGAPKPDISTSEKFKQAMLAAKSIVYVDPAQGATSGIHVAGVLQRLGIAEAVKSKTILWPGGYAAEAVQKGDAEIVVHQISEILPVKGVTLVGPLPSDLQKITTYSAGIATKAQEKPAAELFIKFLARRASKAKFAAAGLDYKE
jgi:molybdate transport system substrate-binding protein